MRSGTKTELVTIQSSAIMRNATNNEAMPVWSTWRSPWCRVEVRRGREHFSEGQRHTETVTHFFFDYLDVEGLTDTMRIVFKGETYDIRHIVPSHELKDQTMVEGVTSRAGAIP